MGFVQVENSPSKWRLLLVGNVPGRTEYGGIGAADTPLKVNRLFKLSVTENHRIFHINIHEGTTHFNKVERVEWRV